MIVDNNNLRAQTYRETHRPGVGVSGHVILEIGINQDIASVVHRPGADLSGDRSGYILINIHHCYGNADANRHTQPAAAADDFKIYCFCGCDFNIAPCGDSSSANCGAGPGGDGGGIHRTGGPVAETVNSAACCTRGRQIDEIAVPVF